MSRSELALYGPVILAMLVALVSIFTPYGEFIGPRVLAAGFGWIVVYSLASWLLRRRRGE
jgi:hypothetical protein